MPLMSVFPFCNLVDFYGYTDEDGIQETLEHARKLFILNFGVCNGGSDFARFSRPDFIPSTD